MSPRDQKAALNAVPEYTYTHHSLWRVSAPGRKRLKNLFEISSITILLAASSVVMFEQQLFAQLAEEDVEWLVYHLDITENGNVMYQISIPYPATWEQRDGTGQDQNPTKITDFVSAADEDGDYIAVGVWIQELSSSMDIEAYQDSLVDYYSSIDHEVVSSDVGEFTLVGMPAYSLETTYRDSDYGPQVVLEVGTIIDNSLAFYIRAIADRPIYEDYLPVLEQMISSTTISSGTGQSDTLSEGSSTLSESFGGQAGGGGKRLGGLQGLSGGMSDAGADNATTADDQIGGGLGGFGGGTGGADSGGGGMLEGIFGGN